MTKTINVILNVLNNADLCRCELNWKTREDCAEGDAENCICHPQ